MQPAVSVSQCCNACKLSAGQPPVLLPKTILRLQNMVYKQLAQPKQSSLVAGYVEVWASAT